MFGNCPKVSLNISSDVTLTFTVHFQILKSSHKGDVNHDMTHFDVTMVHVTFVNQCFSEMLQHPTLNFGTKVAEERLRAPAELSATACRYVHTTLNYKILSNRVVIVGTVERQTKMVSVSFVANVQTQTGPSLWSLRRLVKLCHMC